MKMENGLIQSLREPLEHSRDGQLEERELCPKKQEVNIGFNDSDLAAGGKNAAVHFPGKGFMSATLTKNMHTK